MKKAKIYKILEKVVFYYKSHYEIYALGKIGEVGKGCNIEYPVGLGHPELIKMGSNVHILSNARISSYPELTGKDIHILIGSNTWIGRNFCMLAGDNISIGENVIIADDVSIISENHGINPEDELPYSKQPLTSQAITVGNGVWIGKNTIILPGIKIGEKCVIGGGSVVTKDIEPYCVAAGNPAKVIKKYNFEKHKWE